MADEQRAAKFSPLTAQCQSQVQNPTLARTHKGVVGKVCGQLTIPQAAHPGSEQRFVVLEAELVRCPASQLTELAE
ncbi:hypothetical protein C4J98_1863 [Pseudomonas orientalis]|uniref:hypothetical protein n=1 Tax=Pseudomonas orientalis TaxID=76758 RepID=UPI000F5797DF|nr:hypothetical protein [Pseudomonas orientalis]AZE83277.1 hypothetical protein C4J98_1863 [Pseudomonas orientalis]